MTTEEVLDIGECRILVVEDNEMNRVLAAGILQTAGFSLIEFASDGQDGLEKVETFSPDLIVLDIMMPRMDGQEFLRRLRADRRYADLPVLVTTALDGAKDRNTMFELGATDYLGKPINRREMIARVKVHLRNRVMLARLRAYRDRVSQDLTTLASMQEALLPSPDAIAKLSRAYSVSLAPFFDACFELGGDLWGAWALDEARMCFFMADFSGHGVTAAVNTFRLHLMMEHMTSCGEPAEFLARLNAALFRILPRGQYATMIHAVLDTRSGDIVYASAGAPAPVLCMGDQAIALPAGGLPLGFVADASYVAQRASLPPEALLCLYSDALVETVDSHGTMLGEAGAVELIGRSAVTGSAERSLANLLKDFMGSRAKPLDDDLTILWLGRSTKSSS